VIVCRVLWRLMFVRRRARYHPRAIPAHQSNPSVSCGDPPAPPRSHLCPPLPTSWTASPRTRASA